MRMWGITSMRMAMNPKAFGLTTKLLYFLTTKIIQQCL